MRQQSGIPELTGHPNLLWGIAWMVCATCGFVTSDTISKFLLETYAIPQVIWARYTVHFLVILALMARFLPGALHTRNLPLQLYRSGFLILATIFFFAALSQIDLATASAIFLMAPLIVTALSGQFLRENVDRHRWVGVAVGFIGAMIVIQPGGEQWHPAMIWGLLAAAMYAFYQISTRALSDTDRPVTTVFYTSLPGVVIMSFVVLFFWRTPEWMAAMLMCMTGVLSGFAHYAIIRAFQEAPASVITPFGYTSLLWAIILGFFVFAELPTMSTLLGAAIIVGSGIYIARIERGRRRMV